MRIAALIVLALLASKSLARRRVAAKTCEGALDDPASRLCPYMPEPRYRSRRSSPTVASALRSLTQVVAVAGQQASHPGAHDRGRLMIMPQSSASIASMRSTVRAPRVMAPLRFLSIGAAPSRRRRRETATRGRRGPYRPMTHVPSHVDTIAQTTSSIPSADAWVLIASVRPLSPRLARH